jgi:hypothetical protein
MAIVIQAQDEIYFPIHHLHIARHIIVMHDKTHSIQVQYQKIMTVQGGHIIYRLVSYLGKYSLCIHMVQNKEPKLNQRSVIAYFHTLQHFNTT